MFALFFRIAIFCLGAMFLFICTSKPISSTLQVPALWDMGLGMFGCLLIYWAFGANK